ncbi:MAG TPA: multicopper oxidase domain-containing protein [Burkholderiales bacterium]|nr:multicopper oxidase domain-containing protein [Burkholderiales bacterium]
MVSRRDFLRSAGALGVASMAAPSALFPQKAIAQAVTAALNAKQVPQFVQILPNPLDPAFIYQPDVAGGNAYTLRITEFTQQLGLAGARGTPLSTTLWGYGTAAQQSTFPGRTFELQQGQPITVTYVNDLVDAQGAPLPNRMPVDTTLDWANPGAVGGLFPVPAVAHLHGGDSAYLSDGLPDAWETPDGQRGRLFATPYTYENNQEAGTLWYHDHALGITRTNVYMGLAGFYILRDANENSLRASGVLPSHPYEVPVVIQDRMFTANGALFYPSAATGNLPNPTHLPEFFGDVVLVNGKTWPKLNVEPRKYRLRMLNGSDSRFYDMRFEYFTQNRQIVAGAGTPVPVLVIGNELGLLDTPALPELTARPGLPGVAGVLAIGPGERYDVIVDFSAVPAGTRVVVTNTARSPYPDAVLPENRLTDRLLAFDVTLPLSATPNASVDIGTNLRPVAGPLPLPSTTGVPVRKILLFEGTDALGRLQTMLGPVDPVDGVQGTLTFKDPITERPALGTTEVWEFYNTTVDAHPMHMHLVDFRILDRQTFTGTLTPKVNSDGSNGAILNGASIVKTGNPLPVSAWESGKKDTVKLFPGEVTRVLVSFNRRGEYVYHCHILSHEDHEMMRPYEVI